MSNTEEFYRIIGLDPKKMKGLYPNLEAILDSEDEE
jgi:hypothetical protein